MRAYLLYKLLYLERVWPVVVALAVFVLFGLIDGASELRRLDSRLAFSLEFQRRWMNFFMAGVSDEYKWLAENQAQMTNDLGSADRITYRAPFSQYAISNYPMLTNTLARSRSGYGVHPDYVNLVDHLLISWAGVLKQGRKWLASNLKNPFYVVGRGVRYFVGLPLTVLAWSGLLAPATVSRAQQSAAFRIIQLLVGVIALAAAIVTIVAGWDAFVTQLAKWIPWL